MDRRIGRRSTLKRVSALQRRSTVLCQDAPTAAHRESRVVSLCGGGGGRGERLLQLPHRVVRLSKSRGGEREKRTRVSRLACLLRLPLSAVGVRATAKHGVLGGGHFSRLLRLVLSLPWRFRRDFGEVVGVLVFLSLVVGFGAADGVRDDVLRGTEQQFN